SPSAVMLLMIASPLMRLFSGRLNQSAARRKRIARGIAPVHSVEWKLNAAVVETAGYGLRLIRFQPSQRVISGNCRRTAPVAPGNDGAHEQKNRAAPSLTPSSADGRRSPIQSGDTPCPS